MAEPRRAYDRVTKSVNRLTEEVMTKKNIIDVTEQNVSAMYSEISDIYDELKDIPDVGRLNQVVAETSGAASRAEDAADRASQYGPRTVKDATAFFALTSLEVGVRYVAQEGMAWDTFPVGTANIHFSTGGAGVRAVPMADGYCDLRQFAPIVSNDADVAWVRAAAAQGIDNIAFPRGTYDVTTHIEFGRRVSIKGAGRRLTTIRCKSETGFFSFATQYCSFGGFSLQCTSPSGSAEYGISQLAGYVFASDMIIDWGGTARFKNAWRVPLSANPWVGQFNECVFTTTGEAAFKMSASGFNHALFSHCTFRSAQSQGGFLWDGLSSHGVLFNNCRWENNKGFGISIAGRRGNQCSFVNPYFEHNEGADMILGSTAPSWNTDADYMEPVSISGLTSFEANTATIDAYKVRHVSLSGASIGANAVGYYTSGALRASWGTFPFAGPQLTVNGLSRRGSATDFVLVPRNPRIMVESGDGVEGVAAAGFGPSVGITRPPKSPLAGAFASHTVTLGDRDNANFPGVSVFAGKDVITGPSRTGAIIGSANITMTNVGEGSSVNAVIGSEYSTLADTAFGQVLLASARVKTATNRSVAGGYAASGEAASANRKWEFQSQTGNVLISGAVTSSNTFADFAELFENYEDGIIPVGSIVALEGGKVRLADAGDEIAGVISATAAIIAGDTPFAWQGRYLVDDFGALVTHEVADAETGELVTVPVENPAYDADAPQVPRSQRPNEWSVVGLLGQVFVRVGSDVQAGDRVASGPGGIGIPADGKTGLRCMTITKPFDVALGYAVARCLLNVTI